VSRPDDYGIVAAALRQGIELRDGDRRADPYFRTALAALERLAEGEPCEANRVRQDCDLRGYYMGKDAILHDCAKNRRDCLAKVRG